LSNAQPKNALVTPPPNFETNAKVYESARVTEQEMYIRAMLHLLQFYIQFYSACMRSFTFFTLSNFCYFITFKLRSTTERMPALVLSYVSRAVFRICASKMWKSIIKTTLFEIVQKVLVLYFNNEHFSANRHVERTTRRLFTV
jgi:hypothetical protein